MYSREAIALTVGLAMVTSASHALPIDKDPVPLVEEGDDVSGVGLVTSVATLAINDSGDWLVEADTDNVDTDADSVLLSNGTLFLREGDALPLPSGATLDSFDSVNLTNGGDSGFNFFLDGTSGGTDDSGVYFGTSLLIQESDVSTAPEFTAGTPYIGFFDVKINESDQLFVVASVDDPGIGSTVDRALVLLDLDSSGNLVSETVLAKEEDTLAGQTETVSDFGTGPHGSAFNDSGDYLFFADLTGDSTTDGVIYLTDALIAQEGSASPVGGRNWSSLSGTALDLNDNGDYVFRGTLDGDSATNSIIVLNGAKLVQEGDTNAAISPFLFTSFGTGPVLVDDAGNVLWYGDWDDTDTDVDTALFFNDQILVQEGVTTIGGVVVDTLRGISDGYALSDNGAYVIFEAVLLDGTEGAYLAFTGAASSVSRNGTGCNPVGYAEVTSAIIGANWDTTVDIATPGANLSVIGIVDSGTFGAKLAIGEVLVDVSTPFIGGLKIATGSHSIAVPNDCSLIGITFYTQAATFSPGDVRLNNAIDPTFGTF